MTHAEVEALTPPGAAQAAHLSTLDLAGHLAARHEGNRDGSERRRFARCRPVRRRVGLCPGNVCEFSGADLSGVNLRNAQLGTDLARVDHGVASLIRADLTSANRTGAMLGSARLVSAVLGRADVASARIDGLVGITDARPSFVKNPKRAWL